jgi:hypothetical protein
MSHEQVTELLDRYFAGETSREEERQLQTYFRVGNVAEQLLPYRPLFSYWERERRVKAPARVVNFRPRRRQLPRWLLTIAAGLALLLAVNWALDQREPDVTEFPVAERTPVDWSRYEITDEKEALRFVRSVLQTTSDRLHQGPEITLRELREVNEILD